MSIFHTLRYPISYPPKVEELAALPPKLFEQWKIDMGFERRCIPEAIVTWYKVNPICKNEIEELRARIKRMRRPL